jgi:hypothetical protein
MTFEEFEASSNIGTYQFVELMQNPDKEKANNDPSIVVEQRYIHLIDLLVNTGRSVNELVSLTEDQAQYAFDGPDAVIAQDERIAACYLAH